MSSSVKLRGTSEDSEVTLLGNKLAGLGSWNVSGSRSHSGGILASGSRSASHAPTVCARNDTDCWRHRSGRLGQAPPKTAEPVPWPPRAGLGPPPSPSPIIWGREGWGADEPS